MWNEILGALTILGMILVGVVLIPASPKLVDAVCDRIRYGIQTPVDDIDEDQEKQEEAPAAPAPKTATKPVAATTSKTSTTATKPTAARTAA